MPPAAMRSGTPRLSDLARHVVQPSGIASTGWPAVRDTCRRRLGVTFDPWQDGAGRLILAKRADGKLAAMVGGVGMSLPRQVGKTYLIGAMVFALCVNNPGMLVIWTAHHARTHGETFLAMQSFAKRSKVAPYVAQVFTGSGDEEVRFGNGSRILFGARERGFGRGVPGVDVLVMDEGQILSDRALDNMLATLNTSQFGLALFIGTPPRPEDNSEAFRRMRTEALAGESDDTVWIEFGADPGTSPDDRKQWAKANPSFPARTPAESIMRLRKKLGAESFLREGLGIWDSSGRLAVFGDGKWESCSGPIRSGIPMGAIGVAVGIDLQRASVVAAAEDGARIPVKPLRVAPDPYSWLTARVVELHKRFDVPVVIDGKGPGAVFVPELKAALGDDLHVVTFDDVKDACAGIFQAVQAGALAHESYPELDQAVADAVKREVADRWAWGRRKSGGDISPLEAATLAVWGLSNVEEPTVSAYESRGVLTV